MNKPPHKQTKNHRQMFQKVESEEKNKRMCAPKKKTQQHKSVKTSPCIIGTLCNNRDLFENVLEVLELFRIEFTVD